MSHPLTDSLPDYLDALALRQACGEIEERVTRERGYWEGEASRYAGNADHWREKCDALRAEVEALQKTWESDLDKARKEMDRATESSFQQMRKREVTLRAEVEALRGALSDEKLLGAIARGWCSPENSGKEMDAALAFAIAESIQKSALTPAE